MKKVNTSDFAKQIRIESLKMVYSAKASHIGGALSMADILAVLYNEILSYNPANPNWSKRDRFLLSKGHACVSLYATLALKGFFPMDVLDTYAQNGSLLLSHSSHKIPGVEISAGSLGHVLSICCGLAYGAKIKNEPWRTFCLAGDGELNEGSMWEAIMFASHHKLEKLILIIDYNKIQAMGNTNDILNLEPLQLKFENFGWAVREINGHKIDELKNTFSQLPFEKGKPSAIIAHTIKGKGVDFMEDSLAWHYKNPNEEQFLNALNQIKQQ